MSGSSSRSKVLEGHSQPLLSTLSTSWNLYSVLQTPPEQVLGQPNFSAHWALDVQGTVHQPPWQTAPPRHSDPVEQGFMHW
jgi:hypothetical protein